MGWWSIMSTLVKPIIRALDYFRQWFGSWWGWILGILTFILTPLDYIFAFFTSILVFIQEQIQTITNVLNSVHNNLETSYPMVYDLLALANAILPVNQLLLAFTLLFTLWLISLGYRFAKSWLPTLS
jgi:hypothetical protein